MLLKLIEFIENICQRKGKTQSMKNRVNIKMPFEKAP
jgi:hypothetical protein